MKRLSIIAVTAIAALLSASCNKSIETPMVPVPQGSIILDLDILGFSGDTKAVKNGWAVGDKLNLWFDDWNYTEQENKPIPDLVITYDGKKWTAGALASGRSLKPNGKFSVLYEGFNKLSEYKTHFSRGSQWFTPHSEGYGGDNVHFKPLVFECEAIDYNYNYNNADNKLSATISSWQTPTALKVLVKGLNPEEAKNYILQTANVTTPGTEKYPSCFGAITVRASNSCPTFGNGSSNKKGYMGGVPDADGVAFYYNSCDFTNATVEFRLFKKDADGNFVRTAKAPKFTGKTLVVNDDKKTIGVAIDISKFE